jgi:redox-sensitive bicupin YhaK (pirin superfamily)
MNTKKIAHVFTSRPTIEGAGVKLHRGFANAELPRFDPFLLFDDFSSPNPADYLSGFPMHPHRGIETVTYILDGDVRHRDSIGNSGVIGKGDLQWMSSGRGIIHEEMPEGTGGIKGFQLWVNIPQKDKMSAPRYQEISNKIIPVISLTDQAVARVIAGNVHSVTGPVQDVMANPLYLDITLERGATLDFPTPDGFTTFIYIFDGALDTTEKNSVEHKKGSIILFERDGEIISVQAGATGARFLLVSGKPLNEPIAWYGPIVMNTEAEIKQAFEELQTGKFIT